MQEYVRIAAIDNQFEAQILTAVLEDKGLPYLLKSYYDSAYDGLFQGQKGWGAVFAPAENGPEIISILVEIRQSDIIDE